MDLVVVAPDAEGLALMLAELIKGNLEREPERARLLTEPGKVNITVEDAEVEVGLLFTGAALSIGSALPDPDLWFRCDSDVLMALTNVPLRFGMPDQLTKPGRQVSQWLMNGTLKVKGIPRHLGLMIRLQRLFTVA